jgi:hypothetical protein
MGTGVAGVEMSHLELDRDRMAGMVALREAEGIVGVVTLGVVVDRQVEERRRVCLLAVVPALGVVVLGEDLVRSRFLV